MAEVFGPFDTGAGSSFSEDGWGKLLRTLGDGVIYQTAAEVVSPYTGQAFNTLKCTAAGGLDINVAPGVHTVHGFMYENTATKVVTLDTAPATAGQSRRDLIIVRVDRTANTATVVFKKGTAAASPVDPTLTRSDTVWELPLARVTIGTNVINLTNANIVDGRQWAWVPQDKSWSKLKKTGSQTINGGPVDVTFAADLGGSDLVNGTTGFVIPCNGRWDIDFYTQWTLAGSITLGLIQLMVNGSEVKRDQQTTSGLIGTISAMAFDIGLIKYPLATGDIVKIQATAFGSTTSSVNANSFATAGLAGPSNVGGVSTLF